MSELACADCVHHWCIQFRRAARAEADLTAARTRVAELEGERDSLRLEVRLLEECHREDTDELKGQRDADLAAYKTANDERFMTERDQTRAEVAALEAEAVARNLHVMTQANQIFSLAGEVAALRETLGWAANLADPLYSFGVSERLALGRKAREVLGLPALDASSQADRPRFVDPGRGPRQAVVASPQAAPPAYHSREHLAAALTWVERNTPKGIALVARALSATDPDEAPAATPVQGAPPLETCVECKDRVPPHTLSVMGRCRKCRNVPAQAAPAVQGAPTFEELVKRVGPLPTTGMASAQAAPAVQGAPPEVIPAINGPWIPQAAPADGPTCETWCGDERGRDLLGRAWHHSGDRSHYCTKDCADAGRPLHPAPGTEPSR